MNTEELIRLLAADARPVPAHGLERRFALAVALGHWLYVRLRTKDRAPTVRDVAQEHRQSVAER